MEKRIKESLAFTGLSGRENRKPRELSGGEKQRLLLAVLLAWDPPVYLLDEPLSALDPAGAREILDLLIRLNREQGKTIVLAEKSREGWNKGISRFFRMDRGRLTESAPPENISSIKEKEKKIQKVSGTDKPVLSLEHIRFAYPGFTPLFRNFSLEIAPGEAVFLTGMNGTGKTTLASLMLGLLKPQKGVVKLGERDLTGLTIARRSAYLGYLFQNPDYQLFNPTVREEVSFGINEEDGTFDEVLDRFGLSGYAQLPPALLSFAMRKRVALASVYARDTPFVILDEPDWGQDREGLEGIVRYVREGTARGKGFLVISHNPALVEALADREIRLPGRAPMVDPRTRLIGVLIAITALFFYKSLLWPLIMLAAVHLLFLGISGGGRVVLSVWKKLLPLILFILILWPLFDPSRQNAFFQWGFIRLGRDNLTSSALMVLRLCLIVFLCYYPLSAVSQSALILSLVRMGVPYHWAFTVVLALQSVPDFTERWQKIRQAQQARGLELEKGHFAERLGNLIPLLTAVIVSALRDSEQLSYALINRGLDRPGERTWLEQIRFRLKDGFILLLLTLLLLCPIIFT